MALGVGDQVLDACRRGEPEAWGQLVAHLDPWLRRLARRAALADDGDLTGPFWLAVACSLPGDPGGAAEGGHHD